MLHHPYADFDSLAAVFVVVLTFEVSIFSMDLPVGAPDDVGPEGGGPEGFSPDGGGPGGVPDGGIPEGGGPEGLAPDGGGPAGFEASTAVSLLEADAELVAAVAAVIIAVRVKKLKCIAIVIAVCLYIQ